MRAKDSLRLSVIRSLKSKMTYKMKEPNAPTELDDAAVAALIQSSLADLDKTITEVSQVASERSAELVATAQKEKTILLEFLPKQVSESDVVKAIGEVIAANNATRGVKDMKVVLPLLAKQFGSGVFDAKLLGKLVKSELEKAEKKD